MKKLLSVVVALVLLTAVFAGFGTASAANYVGEFSSSVSSLFNTMLYGQGLYDEPLGEISIRPSSVLEYTFHTFDKDDYLTEAEERFEEWGTEGEDGYYKYGYNVYHYSIPEAEFLTRAKRYFNVVEASLKISTELRPQWECVYHADTATFEFIYTDFGGYGGGGFYSFYGYVAEGGNYAVYGYYVTYDEDILTEQPATGTYVPIVEDGVTYYYPTEATIKTTVSYNGKYVKFLKWEHIDPATLPARDTLIHSAEEPTQPEDTTSSDITSSDITSSETTATETIASNNGLALKGEANVFPEGTVVSIAPVAKGDAAGTYTVVETALKEKVAKFTAYEITAKSGNVSVQPNGTVTAYFAIPQGYDTAKIGVYYVSADGQYEEIPSTVNAAEGVVVANLSHFSTYVVAEKTVANPTPSNDNDDAPKNFDITLLVIIIVILVLVATVVLLLLLVVKKTKK